MDDRTSEPLKTLEELIAYEFRDRNLLKTAFTHRSYLNENPDYGGSDNERLEFLGDAVLDLCISDLLIRNFPESSEGQLSKIRAGIVNEQKLAALARRFELGNFLLLGRGEEGSGGRNKNSILANCFEALIAAVYLDSGFEATRTFVEKLFKEFIFDPGIKTGDYKSRLQEFTQRVYKEIPQYRVIEELGPDHDKYFVIGVSIPGIFSATGKGRNKKEAEQEAARFALDALDEHGNAS